MLGRQVATCLAPSNGFIAEIALKIHLLFFYKETAIGIGVSSAAKAKVGQALEQILC